ncbi:CDP-glycerol glycerophosphotransferase family protein [Arthrobacter yangruifuii]|uniref:CDP-glycerol glycerophosphotransferase family protein n=1 Tax=Arthrobacter yangruifuii TaxID=2606616 RepID=UPI001648B5BA|nr:CDP-glycerol glycerophosphotransferase family protein [Arthrobacter yangruifuii]
MIGWQALYAHARNLEKKDEWDAAAVAYARILRSGENHDARVVFRLGHAYFRLNRMDDALPLLEQAVHLEPGNAAWHYRLGFVLERQKHYNGALTHYRAALDLQPGQTGWLHRVEACEAALSRMELDAVVKGKGPTWQLTEVLKDGLAFHPTDYRWAERLGDAYFKMGRYELAGGAYARSAALQAQDANLHFKEGWAWQLAGRAAKADQALQGAVACDKRLGAKDFGVGVFFEARGQWRLAANAYAKSLSIRPDSGELHYRLGVARQKIYDWAGAAEAFRAGIQVSPRSAKLYWRLGLSLERLGDLQGAEAAYGRVLADPAPATRYWKYRLGHVLRLQGKYEEACIAYFLSVEDGSMPRPADGNAHLYLAKTLERDLAALKAAQSGQLLFEFGQRAEQYGCHSVAADAYLASVERTSTYSSERYFRLGCALMRAGNYPDACAAFAEIRQFKRAHGVDTTQYMKQRQHQLGMAYTEYLETLEIRNRTIMYESSHGAAASGNPLQLYRAVVRDARFAGFTHVWVMNDNEAFPAEFRGNPDLIVVQRDSDLYLRYLATAGYLINDNTFPPYFIRRPEQKYLNTWHGTPLKTLGRDIKGGVLQHKNAARNFLHATHMIAPNDFTADCLLDRYDVAGLYSGRLAVTGYPRIDATLGAGSTQRDELRQRLGIPADKKVVLYAPTWRGDLADRKLDNQRLLNDIEALRSDKWHLLYRGHTMTSDQASGKLLAAHTVPAAIDTNDLLAVVDVLITDYSSIFFDFIPAGRPIIYYAYDREEYEAERGLYFDMDALPGHVCYNAESVIEHVASGLTIGSTAVDDEVWAAAKQKFCPREDGQATSRVLEYFFFDAPGFDVPNKQDAKRNVLLFQGSFLPNGITSSYLNLASHIDREENNVYVVVDPEALASQPARLEKFAQNPEHVRVLARVGTHVLTPEERWVVDKLNTQHAVDSQEMWDIIDRAFAREFLRVFGSASFDSVICFEGYARFWVALLGSAPLESAKKSVYLHNDMYREWKNRFEYLEANFRLYGKFDSLVSVTKSVAEENTRQLAAPFNLDPAAFTFCNNLVNPDETLRMAEEPLDRDIANWVREGDALFVTLGRLSPEKGHAKLIRAFAAVAADHPEAKLAILGDGPLQDRLQQLIDSLGIGRQVLLAGRRANPFAVLKNADCFVFSSDYEGQGLVVLEALILDRPVISTDVVGPRSVLEGGYGLLVKNSVEGLADGFRRFFRGEVPHHAFDYEVYQKEALEKFATEAL